MRHRSWTITGDFIQEMSGCHVLEDNFLKYILRFPSYEDYGIHKKTEYETDLEAESLDVEEVSNMTSNSSLEKLGKKSYKDIIWQWDDAAWIMCAVLMTFTMQVKQEDEGDFDYRQRSLIML